MTHQWLPDDHGKKAKVTESYQYSHDYFVKTPYQILGIPISDFKAYEIDKFIEINFKTIQSFYKKNQPLL